MPNGTNSEQTRSGSWGNVFQDYSQLFLDTLLLLWLPNPTEVPPQCKEHAESKEYGSHYTGNRIIHDAYTKIL